MPKFAGPLQPDIYRVQHDGGEIDRHVGQSNFLERRCAAFVEEQHPWPGRARVTAVAGRGPPGAYRPSRITVAHMNQ